MGARTTHTLSGDWSKVKRQLEHGKAQPAVAPSELSLRSIRRWPGVFQHRNLRGRHSSDHVQELSAAIRHSPTKTLDPITVWWDGKGWACIDGHHRMDAYRATAASDRLIPVEVFGGSLAQAMAQAAVKNSKAKLPMTAAEKSNAAWRLVAATDLSKAETVTAAGVSDGTVAAMRRTYALLKEREEQSGDTLSLSPHGELTDLTWADAKRIAKGIDKPEIDWEEANAKKAQEWASVIGKAFGREAGKYPQVLAMALDLYDSRLMDSLVDWWGDRSDEEDEDSS